MWVLCLANVYLMCTCNLSRAKLVESDDDQPVYVCSSRAHVVQITHTYQSVEKESGGGVSQLRNYHPSFEPRPTPEDQEVYYKTIVHKPRRDREGASRMHVLQRRGLSKQDRETYENQEVYQRACVRLMFSECAPYVCL